MAAIFRASSSLSQTCLAMAPTANTHVLNTGESSSFAYAAVADIRKPRLPVGVAMNLGNNLNRRAVLLLDPGRTNV